MRKKSFVLLIFFFMVFLEMHNVMAVAEIDENANFEPGESSAVCDTGICANTVYGYYGIKATLIEINNNKVIEKTSKKITNSEFNFTKPKTCACGDSNICNSTSPLNFCWNSYFENFNVYELEKILKKINSSYTLINLNKYYLRIEPLVKIRYTYDGDVWTFSGTHNEVVAAMWESDTFSAGSRYVYGDIWQKAHGFLLKDGNGGEKYGVGGEWNVLRNYYTTFKLNSKIGPYKTQYSDIKPISAKKFSDDFNTNIYGKILIKISDYAPKKGKLKIRKINLKNNLIASDSSNFAIYKTQAECNSGASPFRQLSTNMGSGVSNVIELDAGTYYYKETKAPSGYVIGDNNVCKSVQINSDETTTLTVTNKTACEYDFDKDSSIANRIYLYQNKYTGYNELLNFTKSNAVDACSHSQCTYDSGNSCLAIEKFGYNASFSGNNLSCYNDTITVDTNVGYCLTTFSLKNELGKTNFSSKSGQMIIQRLEGNNLLVTGTLKKECYVYGVSNAQILDSKYYTTYIGNLKFDGITISPTWNTDGIKEPNLKLSKDGIKYFGSVTANYYLPKVYAKNGTGELNPGPCSTCKFLGYGILSKFLDNINNKYNNDNPMILPFELDFKTDVFKNDKGKITKIKISDNSNRNACTYVPIPEIITNTCDPKKEKCDNNLNLEFRLIDTSNPFPGKSGTGRKVGSNWCSETNCQNNNDLITGIILNKPNSYGKIPSSNMSKEPIYTIKLTSDTINKIREYNKGKSYDDYTLECDDDGYNCISTFLRDVLGSELTTNRTNEIIKNRK